MPKFFYFLWQKNFKVEGLCNSSLVLILIISFVQWGFVLLWATSFGLSPMGISAPWRRGCAAMQQQIWFYSQVVYFTANTRPSVQSVWPSFLLSVKAKIAFFGCLHVPQCRQRYQVSRSTWPAVWGLTSAFLQETARAVPPTEETNSSPMDSFSLLVSLDSFLVPKDFVIFLFC